MRIRGIRGAIQLDKDTPDEMVSAVSELLSQMLTANQLETEDLVSIIFTATPDLTSEFPAVAARKIGLGNVPLLCSVEIDVPRALPKVVRILLHAQLERPLAEVKHIYLRGATVLRKDLAQ
jgi:chorismate mutase